MEGTLKEIELAKLSGGHRMAEKAMDQMMPVAEMQVTTE